MDKLIQEYIDFAIKHGEFILAGDSKNANKIHKKLMDLAPKIQNDKSLYSLYFSLLEHANVSVRIWTAVELSGTFREKVIGVLKEIEKTDSIHGLTARTSIDMINKRMIQKENWIND